MFYHSTPFEEFRCNCLSDSEHLREYALTTFTRNIPLYDRYTLGYVVIIFFCFVTPMIQRSTENMFQTYLLCSIITIFLHVEGYFRAAADPGPWQWEESKEYGIDT